MSKKRKKELKRAERRKLELERKRRRSKTMLIVSVVLIAIISMAILIAVSMGGNDITKDTDTEPPPSQSQTEVRILASEIGSSAKFYEYDADGVTVKYFVVKGADGEIRVAFDACDVCYGAKKGYTHIGDVMHCINCGNEYAVSGLGTENRGGGCWPSYLPREIDGDDVVIKISDLEEKRYMFA